MKILIIGGTGNISASLTRQALAQGHEVHLYNRGSNRSLDALGAVTHVGDIRDAALTASVLGDTRYDAVVDFWAFTLEHTQIDYNQFRGRCGHYVFISSATVYQKPVMHWPITEDAPRGNPYMEYARNKAAIEDFFLGKWRDEGFPATVVRPSHTYGETQLPAPLLWTDRVWSIADRMLQGRETIVHDSGSSLWTLTHSDDLTAALLGLLGNPQSFGHAFHITGDEVLSWNAIMTTLADALGVQAKLLHIPSAFIEQRWPRYAGSFTGDKAESLWFDNSKIKRFVPGWQARVPFHQGIRRSIAWFRAHPQAMGIDDEYNQTVDSIAADWRRAVSAGAPGGG